ncbi:efflux transporter outer membrane subunit [Fulvimonas soli]|jgi:NodT family efflux transporter outer membrane factor (OMF) lipoprotein|uniref:NodT family efflux transporter outer membrane factor (OMF) lipoprotein n=1 Tax=Fulvimonas soli TaxID=155197 RepID=A0A316IG31_9GAMM|nr:efflux transporter outer membrane subunit [Fulvimonas soli]PWK92472.1 NodT family efflux transporter outer membrane factor (OMF) lipoprotein [Fulvimonas soli]TNY27144.1 multidrug RND transporter [Fulvimonas soli]
MRLHHIAVATALSLALAACASSGGLHPDGKPLDPAGLKAGRSLAGLSPAAWPAEDWWTGLGDPQLDRLIAEALADNPSLAAADARARQAQAQAGAADAERGPTVNAGASVAGARIPTTVLPADAGGGHFAWAKYGYASFSWGLDLWGGKRAAWEAALGEARAAEIEARAARLELSSNVARAYVQLGYAFAQQDVAQAELARARQARELTGQRVAAGLDSQLQLKQADAEVASAEQQRAVADRAIDAARSALAVLLGKGPDRGLDIARPQPLQPAALAVPAQLPAELLGHRPDLVAARWRVEAAAKQIKTARTEFLPNVSISALAGLVAMGGTNLFQMPARFYDAGPSLSLPIFDGGRRRANLAEKDAQYDLAVAQYDQALVGALNQVADDLSALKAQQEQLAAQQRALDAASQAWQLAEQRYKAGVGSYLEALVVRQQLLAAEQRMAALKAQQVDQSVQLIQALGGGFRPQAGDAPPADAASDSVSSTSHP